MWQTPVTIFEDEDEEALISAFVDMSARHEKDYNSLQIARYVFRNSRDAELRAGQAALTWANDLDIKERIRLKKLVGDDDDLIDDKKTKLKVLEGIYKDVTTSAKDRIAAVQLHASIQGEIKKAIEQTNTERRTIPQIVIATYPDA